MTSTSPPQRVAKCQCGALEARCDGEPWRISLCHCFACKARTGSDFTLNAVYREEQVELAGAPVIFERFGEDGGHWVRHYFCAVCGTTLFHRLELRPGSISIAIGCFGTRDFPPPTHEVYTECAMAGLNLAIDPKPVRE
ncbi:MAG: GFA family protein [Sphingomicrobium sp.]